MSAFTQTPHSRKFAPLMLLQSLWQDGELSEWGQNYSFLLPPLCRVQNPAWPWNTLWSKGKKLEDSFSWCAHPKHGDIRVCSFFFFLSFFFKKTRMSKVKSNVNNTEFTEIPPSLLFYARSSLKRSLMLIVWLTVWGFLLFSFLFYSGYCRYCSCWSLSLFTLTFWLTAGYERTALFKEHYTPLCSPGPW